MKTEIRNQMSVETLKKQGIIQSQLRKEIKKPIDPPLKSTLSEYAIEYDECDEDELETDLPDSFDEDFNKTEGSSAMEGINENDIINDSPEIRDRLRNRDNISWQNKVDWEQVDQLGMGKLFNVYEMMEGKEKVVTENSSSNAPAAVLADDNDEPVEMDLSVFK